MPKSFGQIKQRINDLGGNLKPYHIAAFKLLGKDGAVIYERELAVTLQELEKLNPGLITITKYDLKARSFAGKMPYFICFRTSLGESFYKML